MSYNKTNWNTGDTITAEKLNNMETGIEANSTPEFNIIHVVYDEDNDSYSTIETWEEITSYFDPDVNIPVVATYSNKIYPFCITSYSQGLQAVDFFSNYIWSDQGTATFQSFCISITSELVDTSWREFNIGLTP